MTNLNVKQKIRLDDLEPDEFFEDDKKKSGTIDENCQKSTANEKEIQP